MRRTRRVSATAEDYLEAILKLDADKGAARVRDIAAELSVHKSTVSATLKSLAEKGLVEYRPYELARLTEAGRKIAREVRYNHRIIKRFLNEVLLIEEDVAGENACRMEHVMDGEVLDRLVCFVRFLESSKQSGNCLRRFEALVSNGQDEEG